MRRSPCTLWLCVEPRWRTAHATARRTAVDWARQVKAIADPPRYRQAERLIRVCDPLNTHTYASFFRAFPPVEARRLAQRVPRAFTPRHGRWLHRAEPELSVLTRQALSPRRPTQNAVHAQVTAWAEARYAAPKGIHWPFRTAAARARLKYLYPNNRNMT